MDAGLDNVVYWLGIVVGALTLAPYVLTVFAHRIDAREFAKILRKLLVAGDIARAQKLSTVAAGPLGIATNAALSMLLDGSALRRDDAEDYRTAGATTDPETVNRRLSGAFVRSFDSARKGRWPQRVIAALGGLTLGWVMVSSARLGVVGPLIGSVVALVALLAIVRRDVTERAEALAMFASVQDVMYARAIGAAVPSAPAIDAPLSLVIDEPGVSQRELAIEDAVIKIGRLESAHVNLPYDDVARLHAVIENQDGALTIIDLGAAAGTLVNGVAVNKRELHDGDRITIGPCTLTVRVRR
jgi:hypothetical protein